MICPLCKSKEIKYIFTTNEFHGKYKYSKDKFKYYNCKNCESYFPDIQKIQLKNYYTKSYRHQPKFLEKLIIKINFLHLNLITKLLFQNKKLSILDVGAGNGDYLKQLPNNYKKIGIDIKVDNNNSNIIQADFVKYKFKNKFDLIIFSHSLEHFKNPVLAINKAKLLLNKNGKIYISIPTSDSFSFKINPKKAFHLDPPRHIFIPNSNNFKLLLENKFNSVKSLSIPFEFPLDLFWTLKNSSKNYLLLIFPLLKIFKPETKLFICQD